MEGETSIRETLHFGKTLSKVKSELNDGYADERQRVSKDNTMKVDDGNIVTKLLIKDESYNMKGLLTDVVSYMLVNDLKNEPVEITFPCTEKAKEEFINEMDIKHEIKEEASWVEETENISSSDINSQDLPKNTDFSCSDETELSTEASRFCTNPQEHEDAVLQQVETEEKKDPYQCDACKKVFMSQHDYRPHKCTICEKCFKYPSELDRHLLIHGDSRPHKCKICEKIFKRPYSLKSHLLIHGDSRPHKCKICMKRFKHSSHLKGHLLVHGDSRPHKCKICGKTFKRPYSLKSHLLIHGDSRPHKCKICGKTFKTSSHLKGHLLVHGDSRPNKCKICGKTYKRICDVKRHILRHKGKSRQTRNV